MNVLASLLSGLVFAIGLAVGGMTDPNKVLSFLDVTGAWDPSLAFVMGGAIVVYAPIYHRFTRRTRPLLQPEFYLPIRQSIDLRLVAGGMLFGVGWGLGGFCPGPAIVSVASLRGDVLTFVAAMFAGMLGVYLYDRSRASRR
ncbi:MAG: DUF6691 family protein [Nannocystaceae bacterium]|nr:YeeE/YedE family protein [bacterium]